MSSNLLAEELSRELYILQDENNPNTSKINKVYPNTILDQVFDQFSPIRKNLRTILEELKEEIVTGGIGNIIFPVTSVNNRIGDIKLDKVAIGLENVDNTKDIDKPLSIPQRKTVLDILGQYNFSINLSELYNHLTNLNNPHQVTFEQLNTNNQLTDTISNLIFIHNISSGTHTDIRRNLAKLWLLTEKISGDVDVKLTYALNILNDHITGNDPHSAQMILKEDKVNKALSFEDGNIDHTKYPTTRAVENFVNNSIDNFKQSMFETFTWVESINSIANRDELPPANFSNWKKAFFIRKGLYSEGEFAVCREDPIGTYSWEILSTGAYSKFDPQFFIDSVDGMSLNVNNVIDVLLGPYGLLNVSLETTLSNYYTSEYLDDHFLRDFTIIPGTMDGHIRFYINNDPSTMSDEVRITGLKKYAFMDELDEHDIHPLSISNQHLQSRSINNRLIDGRAIAISNMQCRHGYIIGNSDYPDNDFAHEIGLVQLADYLRPLIGGWPDPNIPGGSPWQTALDNSISSPHIYTPGVEIPFSNHSYLMRFTGTISSLPNYLMKTVLSTDIKLGPHSMTGAGGSWVYQSNPKSVTILGGSNITGHTFATVNIDENGLYFESISIGDRMNAPYDIWVQYVKPDELANLSIPGYLTEYVGVQDIYNIPDRGIAGTLLTLSGDIIPSNATYKKILWSLIPGSTAPGAAVIDGKAFCENVGNVNVRATIIDGISYGNNFTKDITISFRFP